MEIARRGSKRLKRLVHDILDHQQFDSAVAEFRMEILELMPLVNEAIHANSVYARRFGVRYNLNSEY